MTRIVLFAALVCVLLAGAPGEARAGCNPNRVPQDAGPRWSPTSETVAFYRVELGCAPAPTGIYVVQRDGQGLRRLGPGIPLGPPSPPTWSPDGGLLAWASPIGILVRDVRPFGGIYSVMGGEGAFAPSWAPRGNTIAYRLGAELRVAQVGSEPGRTLATGLHDTTLLEWSPDGAQIAYTGRGADTRDVFVVDVENGSIANLGVAGKVDETPVWSALGDLAFVSDRDGARAVYVLRPGEASPTRLAVLDPRDPSWSPAGDELAIAAAGGLLRAAARPGDYGQKIAYRQDVLGKADWARDRIRVAYSAGDPCGRYGIHVTLLSGFERRITNLCHFAGSARGDTLRGSRYPDTLVAGAGADRILDAGGTDTIDAGPGDDTIRSRDGSVDTIDCGTGRDVATVDRADRVRRCERVLRP